MFKNDPISKIQWVHFSELKCNSYNPNMVMSPEMKLLEYSLLCTGWIQPVLINKNYIIIDGFHRWRLSQESKKVQERYAGYLPVAILDISDAEAMTMTIRINRAKGSHAALRMSDIIKELIDVHKMPPEQIMAEIGATKDEIDLLYQDGVFSSKNIANYKYSKAWYPFETNSKEST